MSDRYAAVTRSSIDSWSASKKRYSLLIEISVERARLNVGRRKLGEFIWRNLDMDDLRALGLDQPYTQCRREPDTNKARLRQRLNVNVSFS